MKSLSFLVMCLAMAGCCNGQAPPTNSDPAGMMDYTWVVQHSKELDSNDDCQNPNCVRPVEYLKVSPFSKGSNGTGPDAMLIYSANTSHKIYDFDAYIESKTPLPENGAMVKNLRLKFKDDAKDPENPVWKCLTMVLVKTPGASLNCQEALRNESGHYLTKNEVAEACYFDNVIYWKVEPVENSTKACPEKSNGRNSSGDFRFLIPPENGHGTASGGIN